MKADVLIFKNREALSEAAAQVFVETAGQAISARGRFLVALSGGGTPTRLYRLLAGEPYRNQFPWEKTFVFWGDERNVPPDDEGSNYHQAEEALLQHVPIPAENIQRIQGELEPGEAANGYAQTLRRLADRGLGWPRFDLVLLGMGADGHTASLFPGSPVDAPTPTLAVSAEYQGRPAQRVTLTPAVFNSARQVLFLVSGAEKAEALRQVLNDMFMPRQYPAQRIRPADGQVTWLVDQAAAQYL